MKNVVSNLATLDKYNLFSKSNHNRKFGMVRNLTLLQVVFVQKIR